MSEKSGGPEQELRWGEVCFKQRGGDAAPEAVTWPVPLGAGGGGRLVAWEPPPAGGAAQPAPAFRFNAGAGMRASVRPMPVQTPQAARVEWSAGGPAADLHLCLDLGDGSAHRFAAAITDAEGRLALGAGDAAALSRRTATLVCLGAQPRDPEACRADQCQEARLMRREGSPGPVLVVGRPVAVTIPLSLTFASLLEAHAWLLRNPLEVTVDGVPTAAGAQVASKALIEVHCEVAPGAHDLIVSARQRGLGGLGPRRIVYLARRCRIAEGGPRGHTVLDR